jgi:hypothetical protein
MLNFFLNTRIGQAIVLAAAILAAVAITYNIVEQRGYDRCKAEWNAAIANANVETINDQNERDEISSDVSQDTRAKNEKDTADINNNRDQAKEVTDDVYSKPPTTAPVQYGSCVHPVDDRVQDRFDAGYREANAPAR